MASWLDEATPVDAPASPSSKEPSWLEEAAPAPQEYPVFGPPAPPELDPDARLGQILAITDDPEANDDAQVLRLQEVTKLPSEVLREALPGTRARWLAAGRSPAEYRRKYPVHAAVLEHDPRAAGMVRGDENINALERLGSYVAAAAKAVSGLGTPAGAEALLEVEQRGTALVSPGSAPKEMVTRTVEKSASESGDLTGVERIVGKGWSLNPAALLTEKGAEGYGVDPEKTKQSLVSQKTSGALQAGLEYEIRSLEAAQAMNVPAAIAAEEGDSSRYRAALIAAKDARNAIGLPPDLKLGPVESVVAMASPLLASQYRSIAGSTVARGAATLALKGAQLLPGVPGRVASSVPFQTGVKVVAGELGGATAMYPTERGSQFEQFLELKTSSGKPIDVKVAALASRYGAAVVSLLDAEGSRQVVLASGPWGRKLAGLSKETQREFLRALLTNKETAESFGKFLLATSKPVLKGAAGEAGLEGLQDLVADLSGYFTRTFSGPGAEGLFARLAQEASAARTVESLASAAQTSLSTFAGMGVIAAPGHALTLAHAVSARQEGLRQGSSVATLAGVASSSETAQVAPKSVAAAVKRLMQQKGAVAPDAVYVTVEEAERFFQAGGVADADIPAAISQTLGEAAAASYHEAAEGLNGGKIRIPMADYLSKAGPTGFADAMVQDSVLTPTAVTQRRALKERAEINEVAKKLAAEYEKTETPHASEAESIMVGAVESWLDSQKMLDPDKRRKVVSLWRALSRTTAQRFGLPEDVLFDTFTVEAMQLAGDKANPAKVTAQASASRSIIAGWRAKSPEDRVRAFYEDRITGALNPRGLDALIAEKKPPLMVVWDIAGGKAINDDRVNGGHERLDQVFRGLAQTVHAEAPGRTGKQGGNVVALVASEQEAKDLIEKVAAAHPEKRVQLRAWVGPVSGTAKQTVKAIGEASKGAKDEAEAKHLWPKRGQAPAEWGGVVPADLAKDAARITGTDITPAMRATYEGLSDFQRASAVYVDQFSELLTNDGWETIREKGTKAVTASVDVDGLKALNLALGEDGADVVLGEFGRIVSRVGGAEFDAAWLHGDEYAGQHDDAKRLAKFWNAVRLVAADLYFEVDVGEGRIAVVDGVRFSYGTGATYAEADGNLVLEKQQRTQAGERGADVDARTVRVVPAGELQAARDEVRRRRSLEGRGVAEVDRAGGAGSATRPGAQGVADVSAGVGNDGRAVAVRRGQSLSELAWRPADVLQKDTAGVVAGILEQPDQLRERLTLEGRDWTSYRDADGSTTFISTGADGSVRIDRSSTLEDPGAAEEGGATEALSLSSIDLDPALEPSDVEAVRATAAPPSSVLQAIRSETGAPIREDGTLNAGEIAETVYYQTRDMAVWFDAFEKNKHVLAVYSPEDLAQLRRGAMMARQIMQRAIDRGILPEEMEREPAAEDGKRGKRLSPLRTNADFIRSLDITTICPRQDTFTATVHAVERKIGKLLSPEQRHLVGLMIRDAGAQPACWYCYGQAGRNAYDNVIASVVTVAGQYLKLQRASKGKATAAQVRAIFQPESGERKWNPDGKLGAWFKENWKALEKQGVPNEVRLRDLARGYEAPATPLEESFAAAARYHAQSSTHANDPKGWATLKKQILTLRPRLVSVFNRRAGLRMNSQTDFRPWHILETTEAVASMKAVSLMAHVYTKEDDFLRVFGKTGIKFNLSALYVVEGGKVKRDAKGRPVFDPVMGMAGDRIEYWVKALPRDVGGMLVATTDEALLAGLEDDRIHQIIPYHAGAVPGSVDELESARDYSKFQHETGWTTRLVEVEGKKKPDVEIQLDGKWVKKGTLLEVKVDGQTVSINAGEPLDASQHLNDQAFYLKLCRQLGLTPKFGNLVLTDPKTGKEVRLLERNRHGEWRVLHPEYMKLIRDVARDPGDQRVPDPSKIDWAAAYEIEKKWIDAGGDKTEADPKLVKYVLGRIERNEWPSAGHIPTESEVKAANEKINARRAKSAAQGLSVLFQKSEPDGGDGVRGWVEILRGAVNRTIRIVLTPDQDLSTILHESGHAYMEILGALAERADAPAQVKSDWEAAKRWMGVEPGGEIEVKHAEKWARGFEAYLMEGKSPSAELSRVFARARAWLLQVYREIRQLNAPLDDDIRGVFDRMLATDDEITAMRQRYEAQGPIFKTAEEAGMEADAYQAWLDQQEEAWSNRRVAMQKRLLKEQDQEARAAIRETRKRLKGEVETAWGDRPDVQAWDLLKRGRASESASELARMLARGKPLGIDREAVVAILGNDVAEQAFGTALLAEGGIHPDALAEAFGEETGEGLIRAMAETPEQEAWVRSEVERRLQAEHPSLLEDAAARRAAMAGFVHSVGDSKAFEDELRAVRSKAGEEGAPIDYIKRAAKIIVARKAVAEIRPDRALQDELTAANEALRAAARGNWKQVAVQKQRQLLAHYVWREMEVARKQGEALQALGKRLRKPAARARLAKGGAAFLDGVDSILDALGVQTLPDVGRYPRGGIEGAVTAIERSGGSVMFDLDTVQQAMNQARRDPEDLTVEQQGAILDALKNIATTGGEVTRALLGEKRVDREALISTLLEEAQTNLPRGKAPAEDAAKTWWQRVGSVFSGFDGALLRPEAMLGWLGGVDSDGVANIRSAWFRAFVQPLQRAKVEEARILREAVKPIIDAWDKMPASVRSRMQDSIDGAALFPNHTKNLQAPARRFELMLMALNSGNDSNLQRLLEGRGITPDQLQQALDLLTREEMEWVQAVLDAAESMWPMAQALEQRVAGLAPPKIEARPIITAVGTFRGGYFPAVYAKGAGGFGNVGEVQAAADVGGFFDALFARPGTQHSHLKGRATNFSASISFDPQVIQAHFAQVAHDLAFREAILSTAGLILDPRVQVELNRALGPERAGQLRTWLEDVGRGRGAQPDKHSGPIGRFFSASKGRMAIASMGYAADIAAGDLSNVLVAAVELDKSHWAAGLSEYGRHPAKMRAFALQKSGELRARADRIVEDFKHQIGAVSGHATNPIVKHAWVFMEATDAATATPFWLGAYRQAAAKGMSDADAVTWADAMVRKNFPSHSVVDMSPILRGKGAASSLLFLHGFANTTYGVTRQQLHRLYVSLTGDEEGGAQILKTAKVSAKVTAHLLGYWVAYGVVGEFLSGRGPTDDDDDREISADEWVSWFWRRLVLAPAYSLPFLAAPIEGFLMGKPVAARSAPGLSLIERMVRASMKVWQKGGDAGVSEWIALGAAAAGAAGYPAVRPARAVDYVRKVVAGEEQPEGPLDFLGNVAYGAREGQGMNPAEAASRLVEE